MPASLRSDSPIKCSLLAGPFCPEMGATFTGIRRADAYAPLLDARYAEIMARSTDAVIGLLFKTHLSSARKDPLSRFRYGDHADFDDYIDNDYGPFEVLTTTLLASEALFRTDFHGYRSALVQFKQEAGTTQNGGAGPEEASS